MAISKNGIFMCLDIMLFNIKQNEGPLSWRLPALSSCSEGLGVCGREKKVPFVSFLALSRKPMALCISSSGEQTPTDWTVKLPWPARGPSIWVCCSEYFRPASALGFPEKSLLCGGNSVQPLTLTLREKKVALRQFPRLYFFSSFGKYSIRFLGPLPPAFDPKNGMPGRMTMQMIELHYLLHKDLINLIVRGKGHLEILM